MRTQLPRPIRLCHGSLGQYFVVSGGTVYADLDGDGRISSADRYNGPASAALLAAARHFAEYFDAPFPGAKSLDPEITSGGYLNLKEAAAFTKEAAAVAKEATAVTRGPRGVLAKRPDLLAHLDFFDRREADAMISLSENYQSWRALGYGALKSLTLTIGAVIVFGRLSDGGAIDVERIWEKRPRKTTGVYGPDGNIDGGRLAEFTAVFDEARPTGVLTHDALRAALAERATLGTLPKRQFETLFMLTERINGSKTITKAQFVGVFDGSLFWAVASLPDSSGRRAL